jgi:hypothetical protein
MVAMSKAGDVWEGQAYAGRAFGRSRRLLHLFNLICTSPHDRVCGCRTQRVCPPAVGALEGFPGVWAETSSHFGYTLTKVSQCRIRGSRPPDLLHKNTLVERDRGTHHLVIRPKRRRPSSLQESTLGCLS